MPTTAKVRLRKLEKPNVYWKECVSGPAGLVLIHNHMPHIARTRQGTNGSRAWFSPLSEKYIACDCGWRPELGKHHCVKLFDANK
jgi:hypothetical protein